ncbi:hypothetical protein TorRG33x02_137650 [Trema orientale]|uniref:Uncharacterized protein n=1 Tax=Trema orientale TaxID=63057 RepID=A0A2P5EY64_TREOI|nr:hypothetical protein TorRG33x02_137650 [Trema orientale]
MRSRFKSTSTLVKARSIAVSPLNLRRKTPRNFSSGDRNPSAALLTCIRFSEFATSCEFVAEELRSSGNRSES